MPPVIDPSPITATMRRSLSPFASLAIESPWAHDSTVDACEFSMMSCSDSVREG